jgi:hypothetical protein
MMVWSLQYVQQRISVIVQFCLGILPTVVSETLAGFQAEPTQPPVPGVEHSRVSTGNYA